MIVFAACTVFNFVNSVKSIRLHAVEQSHKESVFLIHFGENDILSSFNGPEKEDQPYFCEPQCIEETLVLFLLLQLCLGTLRSRLRSRNV